MNKRYPSRYVLKNICSEIFFRETFHNLQNKNIYCLEQELIPFFWLPQVDKTLYGFLESSGCILSRKVWWAVRSGSFAQNWGILQTRMDQRVDHMKINFYYFQILKWMLETVRVEKDDEKDGVIYLVSVVLKLSKKVHFMWFCDDLTKKSRSLKAISIYASESSHHTVSENGYGL